MTLVATKMKTQKAMKVQKKCNKTVAFTLQLTHKPDRHLYHPK